MIEFDTYKLGGWLDGFCPSEAIAERLENQARSNEAQQVVWQKKIEALKNGAAQNEYKSLLGFSQNLEKRLKDLKIKVKQEIDIARAIGVDVSTIERNFIKGAGMNAYVGGLGIWCNDTAERRRRAEVWQNTSSKKLGELIGDYENSVRDTDEGLRTVKRAIKQVQAEIRNYSLQLIFLKKLIEKQKILRTKTKTQQEQILRDNLKSVEEKQAIKTLTKKKNINMAIGGALAIAGLIFIKLKN